MSSSHLLTAEFKGGIADAGELPPADFIHSLTGARRLLAHHAHFFITGKTAKVGKSETRDYRITFRSTRKGSFIYDLSVGILASAMFTAGQYAFGDFFRDSLRAISRGRSFEEPPSIRKEPYFAPVDARNAPVFDFSDSFRDEAETLRVRITEALRLMAFPVGRSAAQLKIYLDNAEAALIDRARELEITQAVEAFRQQLGLEDEARTSWH
jgi:hypothetical protein